MNACEHYETLVSAWLDDQLDRSDEVECLDHLVRCPSCRAFYVDARALDGLVGALRDPAAADAPSPEVRRRIERVVHREVRSASTARIPAWARNVAAALVVALGVALAGWYGDPGPAPGPTEVVLGEGGDMTDARFVELTKEVLRSDPRYRSAMQVILQRVARDTAPAVEASFEEDGRLPEGSAAGETVLTETRRIPA
jgi:predicted anti-sigma-YlaC factor YlaD